MENKDSKFIFYSGNENNDWIIEINKKYLFGKGGKIYCRECKNESCACVCMGDKE